MKKTLSFVLAIVMIAMVFATIPFSAFAAETADPLDPEVIEIVVDGTSTKYKASEIADNFAENAQNVTHAAAATGKAYTINFLADVKLTTCFWIYSGVETTVNGNGKTITVADDFAGTNRVFGVNATDVTGAKITIKGLVIDNTTGRSCNVTQMYNCAEVNLGEGNYWVAREKVLWYTNNNITFNITGGYYEAGAEAFFTNTDSNVGTLNISGGIFKTRKDGGNAISSKAAMTLNVTGGTFIGNISATGTSTLTAGTCFGTVTGATPADTFVAGAVAVATVNGTPYASLDAALAAAATATEDVTIKLLADAEITKLVELKGTGNVTIDGDLGEGVRAKVEGKTNGNTIRTSAPGTTLTIKNIDLTANCTDGCLFQIGYKGNAGLTIENCSIKADVKWYLINTMTGDKDWGTQGLGSTNTINIINSTLESNGGNALFSPGNPGTHKQNVVINVTGSTLTGTKTILQINKSCTAQITVKESTLTSTGGDVMTIGEPVELADGQTVTTTNISVDAKSTLTPAEGKVKVNYNAANTNINVTIESPIPEGAIAVLFGSDGSVKAALTDVAGLADLTVTAVDGDIFKLYADLNAGATQAWFYGSVTIDGNGYTWTYNGTDYAICGANSAENTKEAHDAIVKYGLGLTLDQMDTLTVKNLKLVAFNEAADKSAGGFKFYSSILQFEAGNDMNSENVLVLDARRAGKIIVNGGTYVGAGTLFNSGADYNATTPSTTTIEINDGTFTAKRVVDISGSAADPTANTFVINGGTFTAPEDATELKFVSIKNAQVIVNGGTFTCGAAQGNVFQVREGATTKVVIDGATINGTFLVEAGTVEFKTGTLNGNLVVKEGATATKAEGFVHNIPVVVEVYYTSGETKNEAMSFEEALAKALEATEDVTIKLTTDVELKATFNPTKKVNITIDGALADGSNAKITTAVTTNKFRLEGGATYTFKNVDIVNTAANGCLFQINNVDGGNLYIVNCNIETADQHYTFNPMGKNGMDQVVSIVNSTIVQTAGSGIISTGNADEHYMNLVLTIKDSKLTSAKRILQINAGSTADIDIANCEFTLTGEGELSAFRFYEIKPASLKGVKTTVDGTIKNCTFTVPETGAAVKYDDNKTGYNVLVYTEGPDDIVAKIYVEGTEEAVLEVKRSEFVTTFKKGADIFKNDARFAAKNVTVEILMDVDLGEDGEISFTTTAGRTITVNGNGKTLSGGKGGNPIMRAYGAGTLIFNKLNTYSIGTLLQWYDGVTVDINGCTWVTEVHSGLCPSNSGKVNVNAGTTLKASGNVIYGAWCGSTNMITVAEGATLITTKAANATISAETTGKTGLFVTIYGTVINEAGGPAIKVTIEGNSVFVMPGAKIEGEMIGAIVQEPDDGTTEGGETGTTETPVVETTPSENVETTPVQGGETTPEGGETTTAPVTETKGGCGGIAIAAQLLALICAAAAVIVIKKK